MARRLCDRKPPEWWYTGDPGNRLAVLLCQACPARATCHDPQPYGVIIAGIAYSDTGTRLPLCHCGYPAVTHRVVRGPGCCPQCNVRSLPGIPKRLAAWIRYRRVRSELLIEEVPARG